MHEASLVEGILRTVMAAADEYSVAHPEKPCLAVREIICEIGLLAAIEAETLKACFELFSEGTAAEGAKLVIETKPLECQCLDCGAAFTLQERKFVCPACKSENIKFGNASGLTINAVNVDCGDGNG